MLKLYKGGSSQRGFEIRNGTFTEEKCKEWCMRTDLCAAAEYNVINRTCSVHAFSQARLILNYCVNPLFVDVQHIIKNRSGFGRGVIFMF